MKKIVYKVFLRKRVEQDPCGASVCNHRVEECKTLLAVKDGLIVKSLRRDGWAVYRVLKVTEEEIEI